jgi:hypothetical protein
MPKVLELAGQLGQEDSLVVMMMRANLAGIAATDFGKQEEPRMLEMVKAGIAHINAWKSVQTPKPEAQ